MDKVTNPLQALYTERAKYISEEDYIKAEEISIKIKKFKENAIASQRKQFLAQHEQDIKNFEENYAKELQYFKEKWTQREKELNDELNQREQQLQMSQKEEIQYIVNNFDKNIKQKQSPGYLNLKKIQYELAKQERFLEAAQIKKQADQLMKEDNEKLRIELNNKLKKQIEKTTKRHQDEKVKFDDDKKRQLIMLKKEKDREYDAIVNKYRSLKVEMSLQQKEEQMKATKRLKTSLRRNSQESTRNSVNSSMERV